MPKARKQHSREALKREGLEVTLFETKTKSQGTQLNEELQL